MKLYQLIEKMMADGTWIPFCSINSSAMELNKQYAIFSLAQQLEPERSFGYRKRLADYISTNGVKFAGGGYFASGRLSYHSRCF